MKIVVSRLNKHTKLFGKPTKLYSVPTDIIVADLSYFIRGDLWREIESAWYYGASNAEEPVMRSGTISFKQGNSYWEFLFMFSDRMNTKHEVRDECGKVIGHVGTDTGILAVISKYVWRRAKREDDQRWMNIPLSKKTGKISVSDEGIISGLVNIDTRL